MTSSSSRCVWWAPWLITWCKGLIICVLSELISVIMIIADGLAPNWHQAISSHHSDHIVTIVILVDNYGQGVGNPSM